MVIRLVIVWVVVEWWCVGKRCVLKEFSDFGEGILLLFMVWFVGGERIVVVGWVELWW